LVDKDKYNVRLLNFTKQQMLDRSGLSYQQLREITAELADKKFLRYIEPDETFISLQTRGSNSLRQQKVQEKGTVNKSTLSNEAKYDHYYAIMITEDTSNDLLLWERHHSERWELIVTGN
jgi:hypothetical protein